jgi:hypothetical protein
MVGVALQLLALLLAQRQRLHIGRAIQAMPLAGKQGREHLLLELSVLPAMGTDLIATDVGDFPDTPRQPAGGIERNLDVALELTPARI